MATHVDIIESRGMLLKQTDEVQDGVGEINWMTSVAVETCQFIHDTLSLSLSAIFPVVPQPVAKLTNGYSLFYLGY